MERINALITYKRQLFGWYRERLAGVPGLHLNAEPQQVRNSYWMVTVVPEAGFGHDKFSLQAALRSRGIDSRPFFSQLSGLKAYAGRAESARFLPAHPAGSAAAARGINLPSGYGLDEATVGRVCASLLEALASGA